VSNRDLVIFALVAAALFVAWRYVDAETIAAQSHLSEIQAENGLVTLSGQLIGAAAAAL